MVVSRLRGRAARLASHDSLSLGRFFVGESAPRLTTGLLVKWRFFNSYLFVKVFQREEQGRELLGLFPVCRQTAQRHRSIFRISLRTPFLDTEIGQLLV